MVAMRQHGIVAHESYQSISRDSLVGPHLQIAAYVGSPLRVIAGPGTGKTYALMRRVTRFLENGVAAGQILAVTFTRTAASDLVAKLAALGAPMPRTSELPPSTLSRSATRQS